MFSYEDYQKKSAAAQNSESLPKVGFFKLNKDGDSCLVRFNIRSTADFKMAKVHKPVFGRKYEGLSNPYAGIACHNELGGDANACPLCAAVAAGHPVIGKAENVIFVEMLVAYKDPATGMFAEPVPVVWERKGSYSRELVAKLQSYGDLSQQLFIMTRIGSGKDTRYNLDYAVPAIYKPEMIPADFSAFENFKVNKHSFWEKTVEEINEYLRTGTFPAQEKQAVQQSTQVQTAYAQPTYAGGYVAPTSTPAQPGYVPPVQPTAQPTYNSPVNPAVQPAPQVQNVSTQAQEQPAVSSEQRSFNRRF